MPHQDFHDHATPQTISIYEYTRMKLLANGAGNTVDGRLTLSDKSLFLMFVKLERARRLADFALVQSKVRAIESYLEALGKRHVSVFAYMYIRFDGLTWKTKIEQGIDGEVNFHKTYRRMPSQEEIAIHEWAISWCSVYGDHFRRVLYRGGRE